MRDKSHTTEHVTSRQNSSNAGTAGANLPGAASTHHYVAALQPRSAVIEPVNPPRIVQQTLYGNNSNLHNHHRYHSASSTASSSNSSNAVSSTASSGVVMTSGGSAGETAPSTAALTNSFMSNASLLNSSTALSAASSANIEDKFRHLLHDPIRRLLAREVEGIIITASAVGLIERKLSFFLSELLKNSPSKVADVRERIRKLFHPLADLSEKIIQDANQKKKKQLVLPFDRLHEIVCDELRFLPSKVDSGVSLYIVAVLEFMARDLLDTVGRFVRATRRCEITENDVKIIISSDPLLAGLFEPDTENGSSSGGVDASYWMGGGGGDDVNFGTPSPASTPSTPLDTSGNTMKYNGLNSIMLNYYASLPQQELNFAQIANELWAKQKEHCELLNMIRLVFRKALRDAVVGDAVVAAAALRGDTITDADLSDDDRHEFELVFGNIDDVFDVAEQFLIQVDDAKDMTPDPAQLAQEMQSVGSLGSGISALLSASSGSDSVGTGSHPASASGITNTTTVFFPDTHHHHHHHQYGSASRQSNRHYNQQQTHQHRALQQQHRHNSTSAAAPPPPLMQSISHQQHQRHHLSASSHSLAAPSAVATAAQLHHSPLSYNNNHTTTTTTTTSDDMIDDSSSSSNLLLSASSNVTPLHHRRASTSSVSTATTVTTLVGGNNNISPNHITTRGINNNPTPLLDASTNALSSKQLQQVESPRRTAGLMDVMTNNNDADEYVVGLAASSLVGGACNSTSANDKVQFGSCFEDIIEGDEFEEYYTYAERVTSSTHRDALRRLLRRAEIVQLLHASTEWFRHCTLHVLPKILLYPCYYMNEYVDYTRRLRHTTPVREEKELLQDAESYLAPLAQRIDKLCRDRSCPSDAIGFRFSKVHDEHSKEISKRLQHLRKTTENWNDFGLHQFSYSFECDAYKIKPNQAPSERRLVLFEDSLLLLRPIAKPTSTLGMVVASMVKGGSSSSASPYEFSLKYDSSRGERAKNGGATKDRLMTRLMKLDDCSGQQQQQQQASLSSSDGGNSNYANASMGTTGMLLLNAVNNLNFDGGGSGDNTASAAPPANQTMVIHYRNMASYKLLFKDIDDKPKFFAAFYWNQYRSLLVRMLDAAVREEESNSPKLMPAASYRFTQQSDEDAILFEDDAGQRVKAATLEKLVERATSTYNMDMPFITVFLAVYRTFCTAQELMDLLIERFAVPSPLEEQQSLQQPPMLYTHTTDPAVERAEQVFQRKVARPIRMRVLNFLKHWIEAFAVDFEGDEKLISKLNTIIDSDNIRGGQMERTITAIRRRISTMMEAPQAGSLSSSSATSSVGTSSSSAQTSTNSSSSSSSPLSPSTPSSTALSSLSMMALSGGGGKNYAGGDDTMSLMSSSSNNNNNMMTHATLLCITDTNGGITNTHADQSAITGAAGGVSLPLAPPPVLWHITRDPQQFHLLSLHPAEIARQLTLLSHDLYRAINVLDFMKWARSSAAERGDSVSCPNIHRFNKRFDTVSFWVVRTVVETLNVTERIAVMSRVIDILRVLLHLHNYTDAFALIAALEHAAVWRLKLTSDKLESSVKRRLEEFRKLNKDHTKLYREELDRLPSSEPCVPFLGNYLTILNQIGECSGDNVSTPPSSTTTSVAGDALPNNSNLPPLINFAKRRKLFTTIEKALRFQGAKYSLVAEPSIRTFLENLNPYNDLPMSALDTDLFEKSLQIEPRDAQTAPHTEPSYPVSWLKTTGGNAGIKPRHLSTRMTSSGTLGAVAGIISSPSVFSMSSLNFSSSAPLSGGHANIHHQHQHSNCIRISTTGNSTCTTPTSSSSPRSPASPSARLSGLVPPPPLSGGSLRRQLPAFTMTSTSAGSGGAQQQQQHYHHRERCNSSSSNSGGTIAGELMQINEHMTMGGSEDGERNSVVSSSPTLKNATDDDFDSNNSNHKNSSGISSSGGRPPVPPRRSRLEPAEGLPPALPPKPLELSALLPKRNSHRRYASSHVYRQQQQLQQPPPPSRGSTEVAPSAPQF